MCDIETDPLIITKLSTKNSNTPWVLRQATTIYRTEARIKHPTPQLIKLHPLLHNNPRLVTKLLIHHTLSEHYMYYTV